jgi:hypothetical protein
VLQRARLKRAPGRDMASLWPWLAIAAAGALHGLNPAAGWLAAAACGTGPDGRRQALRALLPLALGHAASVALVAAAVALGTAPDRRLAQALAGALLAAACIAHRVGRNCPRVRGRARHAGLALWSFIVSGSHGAGLMLVPALLPLCGGGGPARPAGPLALALAAVAVHTAALLAVTALAATTACRWATPLLAAARRAGVALRRATARGQGTAGLSTTIVQPGRIVSGSPGTAEGMPSISSGRK